jgi:hypothetical protein
MSGFVLHPDALTDLNEIWEYIAADNPGAASCPLWNERSLILLSSGRQAFEIVHNLRTQANPRMPG